MDSSSISLGAYPTPTQRPYNPDELVLEKTLTSQGSNSTDSSVVALSGISGTAALSISADKIIEKLNELLAEELPEGIQSLNPEEFTPEATAERIVQQVTAFFPAYAKQNSELSEEEALESFLTEATKGIEQGFSEAFEILEGLGAFEIEGVEDSLLQTKDLINGKLENFRSLFTKAPNVENAEEERITEKQSEPSLSP